MNKETQQIPYLQPGQLYKLKGLSKNKVHTHMQVYAWGNSKSRLLIADPNARYVSKTHPRLYTDGDLFLCIKVIQEHTYGRDTLAYLLLTPDGKQVIMSHSQNKTKFARASK